MFDNIKGFMADLKTLNDHRTKLQSELDTLKSSVADTQATLADIQTSVNAFQFKNQGHYERIAQEKQAIQNELEKYHRS